MKPGFSPLRYAAWFGIAYAVGSVIYVKVTHWIVAMFAANAADVQRLTAMKAIIFVIFKAILLFFVSLMVFKLIQRRAEQLLESQKRLMQAQRDAIPGMLASSIAHDCSNLLTLLRYNLERLRGLELSTRADDIMKTLDNGIDRLADMASRLRNAGNSILQNGPAAFEVEAAIQETLDLLKAHQAVRDCAVDVVVPSPIQMQGYPVLIHQLLMNLILNAAQAAGRGGRIVVRARRRADAVEIEVHDNGPGIPAEYEDRIFDAFFTTKEGGTGLGLLSVKSCAEVHKGSVSIGESELGGAVFSVSLPDLMASSATAVKTLESLNKTTSSSVSAVPVSAGR